MTTTLCIILFLQTLGRTSQASPATLCRRVLVPGPELGRAPGRLRAPVALRTGAAVSRRTTAATGAGTAPSTPGSRSCSAAASRAAATAPGPRPPGGTAPPILDPPPAATPGPQPTAAPHPQPGHRPDRATAAAPAAQVGVYYSQASHLGASILEFHGISARLSHQSVTFKQISLYHPSFIAFK